MGTCGTKLPGCTTLRLAVCFIFGFADAKHHFWQLHQAVQAVIASLLQDQRADPESSAVLLQISITLDFTCSDDNLLGFLEQHGASV